MRVRTSGGETRIVVASPAGKDLGVFLVFIAMVGTWPVLYIYESLFSRNFIEVTDWSPAVHASLLLAALGLNFIFNTHKVIRVRDHLILMRDGFWHRPLRFAWKDPCVIKLRPIETEVRHRVFEVWQIKLASEGYEYLLDARPNQQILSRRLSEALTRTMGCDLVEMEDKTEIVIASKDLDLPFRERVARYPRILGSPVTQPASLRGLQVVDLAPGVRSYLWDLSASWLLLEILTLVLAALGMSMVEWNGDSIFLQAVSHNNYSYYYGVLLLLFGSLVVLPGYQARVTIGEAESVVYQVSIWRLPVERISIPLVEVEEIRQHEGIRGPVVQVISDRKLIGFRVNDRQVARWLAYELGLAIAAQPAPAVARS